jgi:hypothetical protein
MSKVIAPVGGVGAQLARLSVDGLSACRGSGPDGT